MPNWCESKFAFVVDDLKNKSELKRLYDNLSKACNTHCPEENGFGDSWLGHVAIIHNIPWKSIRCRGYISHIDDFNDIANHFVIGTETAWGPLTDFGDCILEQYKGVSYVYMAEEEGNEIYINTDISGKIFPDKYMFYNEDVGSLYFKDESDFVKYVSKYLEKKFEYFDEIKKYIDSLRSSDEDLCIYVTKFSEC